MNEWQSLGRFKVGRAKLVLEDFMAPSALGLTEAIITAEEFEYDHETNQLKMAFGTAEVSISESSLERLITSHIGSSASEIQVEMTGGHIVITGKFRVLIASVPFRVVGTLIIEERTQLLFRLIEATPAEGIIKAQLAKINPLFDVNALNLPLQLYLDKAEILEHTLQIFASARTR